MHVPEIDGTDPDDLTIGEMRGRREAIYALEALRKFMPGCEDAKLRNFGMTLGIRDTRKIDALYNLTGNDVREQARFDDAIGIFPEFIDGYGVLILPTTGRYWHVPYRALVPKGVGNLLVAGRCIGGDNVSHASARNMMCCAVSGQGAGIAAAVSIKRDEPLDGSTSAPSTRNLRGRARVSVSHRDVSFMTPALQLGHFDLAVVGAGILGLASALAGVRRGLRVVVIDRDTRANGASVRNFGFVTVSGQQRGTMWQRARRSREVWQEVAERPTSRSSTRRLDDGAAAESAACSRRSWPPTWPAAAACWILPKPAAVVRSWRAGTARRAREHHELRVEPCEAIPRLAAG